VYYDALPDPERLGPSREHRAFNHHFVYLDRPYLDEPNVDEQALYDQWSRTLGRPAVTASYENEVDPTRLVGLRGPYCAYLSRVVISPEEQDVYVLVGNTDSFRLYLNGELLGEQDETAFWSPYNNAYRTRLRAGRNTFLLKLLKRSDDFRFTLGIREGESAYRSDSFNACDWVINLSDEVPKA
jgi:hypothetical protein